MKTINTMIKLATISRSIFAWLNTDARKDGQNVSKDSKSTFSPWFVTGLSDAEGCFLISKKKKYYVLSFVLVAHIKDTELLDGICEHFGCGKNKQYGQISRYTVSDFKSIRDIIIPFFENYSLRGTKELNFKDWAKAFGILQRSKVLKVKLTDGEKSEIMTLKNGMNAKRSYPENNQPEL